MATRRIVLLIAITALLNRIYGSTGSCTSGDGDVSSKFHVHRSFRQRSHALSQYRERSSSFNFLEPSAAIVKSDAKDTSCPCTTPITRTTPNVQFLGIEVDGSPTSEIQSYVATNKGYRGPSGPGVSAGSAYQVSHTRTLYVISPAGNVALSTTYPTNGTLLKSTIDSLEGSAQSSAETRDQRPHRGAQVVSTSSAVVPTAACTKTVHHHGRLVELESLWAGTLTSSPSDVTQHRRPHRLCPRHRRRESWSRDYVQAPGQWTSIGGQVAANTAPAATSWGAGRLDVFAQGTNGACTKMYTTTGRLVELGVSRRHSDLITRSDVTQHLVAADSSLSAAPTAGIRDRDYVAGPGAVDLHRRAGCCQYRTGGHVVGRRSSRRLCA